MFRLVLLSFSHRCPALYFCSQDAVEEALLTIAQAAFTSEPRRTFSAVLNGLADRHRKVLLHSKCVSNKR